MNAAQPIEPQLDLMNVNDIDEVLVIERESFTTPWSRFAFLSEILENERAMYLVARWQGKVIGYVGMWRVADEGHITNLAVHPAHRRQSVGRALLAAICGLAEAHGLKRMTLEVRVSNFNAQHLYESFGFMSAGIRPGYYQDNNEDAIIMWRDNPPR